LAISAASPIWRGYLAEIDCRWNVLCAMSDDRTAEERGFEVSYFQSIDKFYLNNLFNRKKNYCNLFSH